MPPYVFPGYPAFLKAASEELGRPDSAGPARRISAVAALANLCAQAALADPDHVAGILAKALEFRHGIATALRAADLMIADVEAGRKPEPPRPSKSKPAPTSPHPASDKPAQGSIQRTPLRDP